MRFLRKNHPCISIHGKRHSSCCFCCKRPLSPIRDSEFKKRGARFSFIPSSINSGLASSSGGFFLDGRKSSPKKKTQTSNSQRSYNISNHSFANSLISGDLESLDLWSKKDEVFQWWKVSASSHSSQFLRPHR